MILTIGFSTNYNDTPSFDEIKHSEKILLLVTFWRREHPELWTISSVYFSYDLDDQVGFVVR